jgi:hypothetical protein
MPIQRSSPILLSLVKPYEHWQRKKPIGICKVKAGLVDIALVFLLVPFELHGLNYT